MRHNVAGRKLGRVTEHRIALLRNLSTALIQHERIRTTLMKAKAMRPFAERLITLSKKDTLTARRRVAQDIRDHAALKKLFSTLAARYASRPGGYTRLYHIGHRPGDASDMALVELVDTDVSIAAAAPETKAEKTTRRGRKGATGGPGLASSGGPAPGAGAAE